MTEYKPKHRQGHQPKADGSCSLFCTCPTPLTAEEVALLGELGIF